MSQFCSEGLILSSTKWYLNNSSLNDFGGKNDDSARKTVFRRKAYFHTVLGEPNQFSNIHTFIHINKGGQDMKKDNLKI